MSYVANQYNYSTPLQSATALTDAKVTVTDNKYFTLFDNKLDGSYKPIVGNAGLWGSSIASADGVLPEPFVVTVTEALTINAISVVGSTYCYPVDFTIELYNGNALIHTYTKEGNTLPSVTCAFYANYSITHYVISITKLSSAGVARVYSAYQSWYVKLKDDIKLALRNDTDNITSTQYSTDSLVVNAMSDSDSTVVAHGKDTAIIAAYHNSSILNVIDKRTINIPIAPRISSHIVNRIDKTFDGYSVSLSADTSHVINKAKSVDNLLCTCTGSVSLDSDLVNIHSAMKATTRRIYGKVYITYTDPLLEKTTDNIEVSSEAYNSNHMQVTDGVSDADNAFFTLYENDLTGTYKVSGADEQVGWTSAATSDSDGYFSTAQKLTLKVSSRPLSDFSISFDAKRGNIAKDFYVEFEQADGSVVTKAYTDNTEATVKVILDTAISNVVGITIGVTRVSKANYPVTIVEIPTTSRFLYTGYQDNSDLVSIDLLEELTYNDDIEALGGVSANEVKVTIDNTRRLFNLNNPASPFSKQLRRNRKVEPYLGTEIIPGEIEWYSLGTYWSYSWDVPPGSLTASVTAFDTIGLLGITSYKNHTVQFNKSLGYLIDYVLNDAKQILPFLVWHVDESLYDVIVPYAWFNHGSHAAALRKICESYPMHIYCKRDGSIAAAPQQLHVDYYYDVWSDSTNIIDKSYSSLYTVLPNVINVKVISPLLKKSDELVSSSVAFNVVDSPVQVLTFSQPYISDLIVDIDCDYSVDYTYSVYSWGIEFAFAGTGTVRSIRCLGTSLDVSNTSIITKRDEDSITANGVVTRDVSADFIQTSSTAAYIMHRLFELANYDNYDVDVEYRGDISLSINDPILMLDSIAPSNKYIIKRHQLTWDGSLTGSANLNT